MSIHTYDDMTVDGTTQIILDFSELTICVQVKLLFLFHGNTVKMSALA